MILGTREKDYFIQTNNKILPMDVCGLCDAVMGISICNYNLDLIPGEDIQPEDRLAAIAMNQNNWDTYDKYIKKYRPKFEGDCIKDFFLKGLLPFYFPEIIEYLINNIYGFGVAKYRYGFNTFSSIKNEIDEGNTIIIKGNFTYEGHYVLICGYEKENTLIINDPAPFLYNNNDGYNKAYKQLAYNKLEPNKTLKKQKIITLDSYQILIKKAV